MTTKKVIIARMEVVAGKETEFITLITPLVAASQAEEGCLVYTVYQDTFTPSKFLFYEEYRDDKAFESHSNTAHFQSFFKNVQPLLAKALDVQSF